jgi:DNA-binding NarL/FixJ family response regulator
MVDTVAQMTKQELKELIETSIEQKLLDLLGDPDLGLTIQATMRERLVRQQEAVARGERGESFEEIAQQLGLG